MSYSHDAPPARRRKPYVPAIGPRLKKLLWIVLGGFALLGVNSVYLAAITFFEWQSGQTYQNYFYEWMFFGHLVLGLVLVLPVLVFGVLHIRNAHDRPNRRAVRVGYALFTTALVLVASGFALARFDVKGFEFAIRDPATRDVFYWIHVVAPLVCIWLFVLHRLAGKRIKWRVGVAWAGASAAFALVMVLLHSQDPRKWNVVGPKTGEKYFFPSLARTSTGNFIPAETLMMDSYCVQCHADVHADWSVSAHRFSSFNNPAYLFSVRETRKVGFEQDGNVQASRFCAGCHDPVPFFSGAFDDPDFDDVHDPTSQAGITCTSCHAITHINSPRGNSDFTVEEPVHYPFAFSDNPFLQWVNRQLVKAKPAFHKKTFLKPLHKTAEFCAGCHKVHLPPELNKYKWLRGQNHYDPYHLSGVSGHGVQSFYYPPKATHDCQTCHMQLAPSDDFGARDFDGTGELKVHDHQFPSANTAIPYLLGLGEEAIQAHRAFNEGVMRLDVFGIHEEGTIDGPLHAPIRPELPELEPGATYLVDVVIRTLKMGHIFTQGTADSNEVWMDVTARSGEHVIGRSGGRAEDGEVDRWSHFVNAYVIDREGRRINRRNAQDIFLPLYSHQIPPGAADVVHYRLEVPEDATEPIEFEVALQYRKFDTEYMKLFQGEQFDGNDLPIMTLAVDRVILPVRGGAPATNEPSAIPEWQRWNDYGIGLLRKGESGANKGELRQAEFAFTKVEELGRPDGPMNLGRVYQKEGRLDEAVVALNRAAAFDPPAYPWVVEWFTGLVNKQNGFLDDALASFHSVYDMWQTQEAREREFDFREDYNLLNEIGQTTFERAKQERGVERKEARDAFLRESVGWFDKVLALDPENMSAHYNLALVHDLLGDAEKAENHRALHARYKPDDNASGYAIGQARRMDPAANHAAEAVVIYDLHRPGAYGLPRE